jgi:putative colanic acid biosynthesis acetyltransferase WcaF
MTLENTTKVIPLKDAPGAKEAWSKPAFVILLWMIVEFIFVTNPLQLSSTIRMICLRSFGAKIGKRVILRPRVRVKFPWNLEIGDDCWIGEGVWIHNQNKVVVSHDVVISQETMITTGSHSHRKDMSLLTRPVNIEAGVWVTSRCMILGGANLGQSCVISPMSVISGSVPAGKVWGSISTAELSDRFK